MLFSYIHVITQTPEKAWIIFFQPQSGKKRSSEGARCIEMRQLLFGDIRHGHFFLLLYILDMQMGQKVFKTRIGMTFMDKIKFFFGKSPLLNDTCGTKIDGTNSFKLKVQNNSSWRGNTTHRSLLKCSVQIRMKGGVFLVNVISVYLQLASY